MTLTGFDSEHFDFSANVVGSVAQSVDIGGDTH